MSQLPFVKYAVSQVLHHAEASEAGGVSQGPFLQTFSIQECISLNNLLRYLMYRSQSPYYYEHYEPESSLLYVVTKENLLSLLGTVLRLCLYTDIDGGVNTFPLRVTLYRQQYDALRGLS